MACLSEETILAYCEGDLNAIDASRCRDHLLTCPACRLTADRYRELNRLLARPVLSEPPPSTLPQVLQRLYPALPRYTSIITAIAASLVFLITWIYVYFDFSGSSLIQALKLTADGTSGWLVNTIKAISAVYNAAQAIFKAGNAMLSLLLPAPLAAVVIAGSFIAFAALLVFLFTAPRRKKMASNKIMRKIKILFYFLLAAGSLLAAAPGKEIKVGPGETRAAAINAFNASLHIAGKVDESIFLVSGSLLLEGEVSGDVICIASRVTIGAGAVIGKDLIVIGGQPRKTERSRIDGQLYHVRTQKDLKKIAASILPFLPESGGMTFFKISKLFFWLILALLALLILPAQISRAAVMLGETPLHHLLRGLVAMLAFALLLLSFLLMSLVLIGIPLLVMLIAAYFLLLIFGRAVVFYFVGGKIAAALKLKISAPLLIGLGVALYALLKFLPFPAALLLIVMDIFAIGCSVSFILRRRKSAV